MTERKAYTVTLSDGRTLSVMEAGNERDLAVIVHNGTPSGAGLLTENIEDAAALGLRLISYARPGYQASTRQPGRSVADAAKDTAELADLLSIERFATWGISGGGPHALACAALLPDRVVAAASLAGVAPYDAEGLDFMAGMGEDNIAEFGAALEGEKTLADYLSTQVPALLASTPAEMAAHMNSLLGGPDKAVFTDAFGAEMAGLMQQAIADGIYGWLDDDLAFTKPWGFDAAQIRVPLQIWQGTQDLMVPCSHGQWLAQHIPQADIHISDTDGHLTLYRTRVPEVHRWMKAHF
ncbi:alpha/beta hydrolase [Alicyclobacillus cycloheptanicus]|uniref:Pimeloyl-ACP methyl ester carboxylesterase n=1 Tax=Alicyclobacillus cycloheptanicus TaxID=1457 RepID=A0ABT9XF77_9BACL|nr:alpha/beta hydrolase [Alicyclobacillus cycloheptanicus]MDQ0188780.1 pimeloyl-ACP methyl ester carboxylesterase [Alicyclobacillus cycloheptanicus]WDM00563.1 alpha/beta hydrolase [Alicyclobacillus cycloheptanicus]